MILRVYCPRAVRCDCPVPARIAKAVTQLRTIGDVTDEDAEDVALIACGPCATDVTVEGPVIDLLPSICTQGETDR